MSPTTGNTEPSALKWLSWVLLGLILGRHHAVDLCAQVFSNPAFARKALFYAAGGIVSASLYTIVWVLTPWRPTEVRVAVALLCCWGILEESQTAVCRVGLGLGDPVLVVDQWHGICDTLSGLPVSTMTLAIPVCVVYWLIYGKKGLSGHPAGV